MKVAVVSLLFFVLSPFFALAKTSIAVIDSGLDIQHSDLSDRIWINDKERPNNSRDDDGNGYKDDVNGWNFAGNDNELIDYRFGDSFTSDVEKYFMIRAKLHAKLASNEEVAFLRTKSKDADFLKTISTYGNYAHGTHVAGISLGDAADLEVMGLKMIPTSRSVFTDLLRISPENVGLVNVSGVSGRADRALKGMIRKFVRSQAMMLNKISSYVNSFDVPVANCSFGINMKHGALILRPVLDALSVGKASLADLQRYSRFLVNEAIKAQKSFISTAPNTLFVIAAGNDGQDNSRYPIAPANIDATNKITVAAVIDGRLARFSNYSGRLVDVAAPGVNIESTVPDGGLLAMSGTSQAAPYVAHTAGLIKEINPDLTPERVRELIMSTVDRLDQLKGKVLSGGIVNRERAIVAAEFVASGATFSQAISLSHDSIMPEKYSPKYDSVEDLLPAIPLPSGF